jgi:glutamate 5-kinase
VVAVTAGLAAARRLVVKVGSSLLVDVDTGLLRSVWLDSLAADVARCCERGQDVLLVSSGAIALGRRILGLEGRRHRLEVNQAAAAAGQIRLAHAYQEALGRQGLNAAQVLLTRDDTESRRRYLNARSTFAALLDMGVVPFINENDTVATEEIRYGDNDRLAARVAQMVSADCLVLLSDVDGLYAEDPARNAEAEFLPEVLEITPTIEAMAGAAGTEYGAGGMVTKIAAARIALAAGCRTVIAAGTVESPLSAVEAGARCTWFLTEATPRTARKNWIASGLKPAGTLVLDDGAIRALGNGKSLLPAGVTDILGSFQRGEAVILASGAGNEIGRGLSAYSADDARRILGHRSGEIEALLGYRGRDEMVHRDDMVLTGTGQT